MTVGSRKALLLALGLSLSASVSPRARAQTIEESAPPPLRPPTWEVSAGVRTMYIKSAGFDPFSTNDGFVQFSLSGLGVIAHRDRLSLAVGLGLDVGSSSATARGAPSSLTLTHLSALAEGRYQPWSRLYLFARLAPGMVHGSATIRDASSPASSGLSADFDAFSLDAGGGAAFCLGAVGAARVGVWLLADGGYGWVAGQDLILAPTLSADQSKAGTLDLGTLAPRGGFFRISMALSY
ncbi:MAG TPA: hypothetical protein VLC06_06595 [Polyangia bacterium]|jgi:hypothetical protein|nr:hypothetical protein [Polyangia bacterium]